jgi:hypothetical protein
METYKRNKTRKHKKTKIKNKYINVPAHYRNLSGGAADSAQTNSLLHALSCTFMSP